MSKDVTTITHYNDLPLEIKVHILWFCSIDNLSSFGQVNQFYNHLIFGNSNLYQNTKNSNTDVNNNDDANDQDHDFYEGYRNTIWKSMLIGKLNEFIDQIHQNSIESYLLDELEYFTENSLDEYIERNVTYQQNTKNKKTINGIGQFGQLIPMELVKQIMKIQFKDQPEATREISETGVTINGRVIRNNDIKDWNSFICNNYNLTNRLTDKIQLGFKGYEIQIDEYYKCQNSWRILFGLGIDFDTFNLDKTTTQYLHNNLGFAYIIDSKRVKILGAHISDDKNIIDTEIVQVGERFSLLINFQDNEVYFFRNGRHIMTITSCLEEDTIYYPIIALCPKKTVTIYPLLSCNYILNENAPKRTKVK